MELHPALFVDKYELTMAQTYFFSGRAELPACFDYFFRTLPYEGGFLVFAGLGDLLELIEEFRFSQEDLAFLERDGFRSEFLSFLEGFSFRGSIYSFREGEIAFPHEPILRVEGSLLETQLIETLLLAVLNFQSLIATKAARVRLAAGERVVSDFGLRRAHGWGGIMASRAAVIGGCDSTSNMEAARRYGIPAVGTMAHSFVQSYDDELEAFREYARHNPDSCILLVDTYDTLGSGIPHAITVAKELEAAGHRLRGIRIDSGDLAYLSRKARRMLDEAGLTHVKIAVSNQLDERVVKSLLEQGAPIDIFGVGTRMVTGQPDAALDGVYKLSMCAGRPRMKISNTIVKTTLPGRKRAVRYANGDGGWVADGILLTDEEGTHTIHHPYEPGKKLCVRDFETEELHHLVMEEGRRVGPAPTVQEIARYARERLAALPPEYKRFEYPHIYKVGVSRALRHLRDELMAPYISREEEDV
ncbi:nicotinate phosphoribosyltransferase [Spirochaeta thermophila DSM 6578]|uniref:Nicotinate phosphoribosyltransferase n=1 Tax=Winmispira thermophila (strain ATCC 700085 / DSM 6578 / Z-1203) TaxID=869211 RepID=G0GA28_WINT7|nr:nicotinate phosphoribosyltransferase [Spirochaeta thermophila]AEJ61716.1 nicotinate phosphoribosyltransferase [Spirochaeta thermophila DSM 6578]